MVLLGEFDILDSLRVTDSNPDFSVNDVVGFHAEFNKEVDWTLVIEGQTSGSRKVITGFSSRLDSNAVVWTGARRRFLLYDGGLHRGTDGTR